jgi:CHASE2 domain-containing sensor protein
MPTMVQIPLAIGFTGLTVTGLLMGMRQLGWLQPLELVVYDQMVRLRPDAPMDSHLLIVQITEADIQAQNRWPLSDKTVAALLKKLQQHQPRAIGLDIYRDLPQEPGHAELVQQLKRPNVFAVMKLPDETDIGVPAPRGMPEEQVGFNDLILDSDGVIRRSLLIADTDNATFYSFSLQLALAYLRAQGIVPQAGRNNPDNLRLNRAEFVPLEPTSGAYQTIDALGYQVLLTYRNRRSPAPMVTLTQVLNNRVNPLLIKDRIVLIGTTALSAKDTFLTPYSPGERDSPKMAGVLLHAQMVSQFVGAALDDQALFHFWPDWLEALWLLGWTFVGGSIAWGIRHPFVLGVMETISLGVLLGLGYGLFLHQTWIPVITPSLGLLMAAGVAVAYRGQEAYRQQQMMMRLLGQNTSPEIATALWKSRDRLLKSGKLPGQKLIVTTLFTDIKGFSTISEKMPPEKLLEWLNEYLNAITQEVRSRQGIINKFTGDGLLAVFGVPVNRSTPIEVSQDAQHAVECALAMRDRLRELNQDWQKRDLPTLQMRVGIFTGPIVAGSLGGRDRLEYGVIGDSVNIAARLESYDKTRQVDDCRILIARETLVHLTHQIQVEQWGPLVLKGKEQTVEVYRVLGTSTAAQDVANSEYNPETGDMAVGKFNREI